MKRRALFGSRTHLGVFAAAAVLAFMLSGAASTFAAPTVESESNNSIGAANPIAVGMPVDGDTAPMGDRDYFSFPVVAGTTYTLATAPHSVLGGSMDTVIALYNGSGTELGWNDDYDWTWSRLGYTSSSTETLYVMVRGYGGDVGNYSLLVSASAPVNTAPVANADSAEVDEDGAVAVSSVLGNDTDAEGDPLTASLVVGASNGSLALQADGSYLYAPNPDFFGTDSFTYRAYDGQSYSDPVAVTITVNGKPDAPVSSPDEYDGTEDTTLEIDAAHGVLDNDSDPDNDELSAVLVTEPEHGTLTLADNGSFSYTPHANWSGTDSFEYNPYDGDLHGITVKVTLNIAPVNDAPVAAHDEYSTDEDTNLEVDAPGVLGNDSDPVEGDGITAVLDKGPSHGELFLKEDGSFSYTPYEDFNGEDSFSYRAYDGEDYSEIVTVHLAVRPINDAPEASSDSFSTNEDTALEIDAPGVLDNDRDADEDKLSAVIETGPENGSLELAKDGRFIYTPDAEYNGGDSFTYRAYDGQAYSAATTVEIEIASVYDPPVAVEDTFSATEDTTLTITAPGLLDNDLGDGPLSVIAWQDSAQGTAGTVVAWGDGRMRYAPPANFNGTDSFIYRISDGGNRSSYVTVTINVEAVNDAPVAVADDRITTDEDTAIDSRPFAKLIDEGNGPASVIDNDTDVDEDDLSADLVSEPKNGSLTLFEDGTYLYTPDENFNGEDSFTYRAFDGEAYSNEITVEITVNAVNDAPVAKSDSATVDEDGELSVEAPGVLGNDSDVEEDKMTAVLADDVANGTLTLNEDGSYTYTPNEHFNGTDSFTYKVSDGDAFSELATVKITVESINDLPVARSDEYQTHEDEKLVVEASGVLGNDSDPVEDTSLSAILVEDVSNGTLELNSDGSFTYTPDENWFGEDSFTYEANDGTDDSESATVYISVHAMNDRPISVDDTATVQEDGELSVEAPGVLGNDSDAEEDKMTAVLVDDVEHGTLTLNEDGSYTYVPDADFHGTDTFTYVADDSHTNHTQVNAAFVTPTSPAPIEPATVTITVTPAADPASFIVTSASVTLPKYGATYRFTGRFESTGHAMSGLESGGQAIAGKVVVLQTSATLAGPYVNSTVTTITAADGSFSLPHVPRWLTYYRVAFAGDTDYTATSSASRSAMPRSYVSVPKVPSSLGVGQRATVSGILLPKHSGEKTAVRVYMYRLEGGEWKSHGWVGAPVRSVVSASGTVTNRYAVDVSFATPGRWKLRAFHAAARNHASSWSEGYGRVTVK